MPQKLLFLLDYHGTLCPHSPPAAPTSLPATTRAVLRRLRQRHEVVILSGRDLEGLRRHSGLVDFAFVGSHGFEASDLPRRVVLAPARVRQHFQRDAITLQQQLSLRPIDPRVTVEAKTFSVAIRWPPSDDSPRVPARRALQAAVASLRTPGRWFLREGKAVLEALPRGFSKARAVERLLKLYPSRSVIYAGDDEKDLEILTLLRGKAQRIVIGHALAAIAVEQRFPTIDCFVAWLSDNLRSNSWET